MRAADPNATLNFVFPEDEELPAEQQSIFPIVNVTVEERAFLLNVKAQTGSAMSYALHFGMDKPKNFFDQKGNPIVFERDEKAAAIVGNKRPWKSECLAYLTPKMLDQLGALVYRGVEAQMEGKTAKNS
jgi:hypothetical protein